jgi:hypothetical protein
MPTSHGSAFSLKYSHRIDFRQPARLQRQERAALHRARRPAARQRDERRGDVDRKGEVRDRRACFRPPRIPQDERRADALLVGEAALGAEPVLAEEVTVVAEEEDEGVVELLRPRERVEEHPDALVDRGHHRRAQTDLLLRACLDRVQHRLGALGRLESERLRPDRLLLHHVVRGEHVRPRREHLALVQVRVPHGDLVAALAREVERPVRRLERVRMHRLVREEERERAVALRLDEAHRALVQEIGDVAGLLDRAPVLVELGVEEAAVALEAHPQVVAGAGRGLVPHVPLADVRGLVAEPLQLEVVVRQPHAGGVACDVVDDPVPARVLAGEDRCAVRRADRRRMERPRERRALVGDPVHVRGLHVRVAAGAELVEAQVVDQDDEEVGFLHCLCPVVDS